MVFYNNELNHNSLVYSPNTLKYKHILLIDNNVKELQVFLTSVNEYTFPIIYSSTTTKNELLELLKNTFISIERIGIVFASNLGTNNTFLDCKPFFINNETSTSYSENLKFILSIIKEFKVKNIDYLACNTLNYSNWTNYYDIITKETGVIVGASNDKTGNIKYGGNWIMESTMQDIEFIYFTKSIKYYSYLLDDPPFGIWVDGINTPVFPIITGNYMYVSSNVTGIISKINLDIPIINNWVTVSNLLSLATDGEYIYYSSSNNIINRIPLNNPNIIENVVIQSQGLQTPIALVINGSYMYVSNTGLNSISRKNLTNGDFDLNWVNSNIDNPFGLITYNNYLYVANKGNGTIPKINLANDFVNPTWVTGLISPSSLAIYKEYMYVVDTNNETQNEGIIWQISLADGTKTIWASGISSPLGIVIQENYMYVTNYINDNILRYEFPDTPQPPEPPISNICFPAGTPINTDQGIIAIEMIDPNIHTINKKTIVDITKTITPEKYLIKFKKNALGLNYPIENTIMSQEHKVYYQGKMREAKTFVEKFERVVKVKYNGEILYNVLMEEYSQMLVNNLICETLHPENIIAKLYTKKCKYTNDIRDKIYVVLIECLEKKDYKNYTKIMKRYCD